MEKREEHQQHYGKNYKLRLSTYKLRLGLYKLRLSEGSKLNSFLSRKFIMYMFNCLFVFRSYRCSLVALPKS